MAEIPNRTLLRGLSMLELLSRHPQGMALYELGEALDLPRSTTFNLAHSLTELDYAWYDGQTGKYSLGLKMFEVGSSAVNNIDVMQVIRGCMAEIHRQINETMHLGILSGAEIVYIDKMESTQSIRMTSYVGSRAPLHCTALGKAVLATMDDDQVRRLYDQTPLTAYTEHTIIQLPLLLEQLDQIRRRGYAVEREEHSPGVCCVGVALRDRDGAARYALSISAPIFRVNEQQVEQYAALLKKARPRIERFLQGAQPFDGRRQTKEE